MRVRDVTVKKEKKDERATFTVAMLGRAPLAPPSWRLLATPSDSVPSPVI